MNENKGSGTMRKTNIAVLKLKLKARKIKKKLKDRQKEKMNIFLRSDFKEELQQLNQDDGGEITESEDEFDDKGELVVPGWKKTRMKFIRRVRL